MSSTPTGRTLMTAPGTIEVFEADDFDRAVHVAVRNADEAGGDAKLLAVPIDKILSIYTHWQKPEDMNPMHLKAIQHFFEHYKDLEPGKWVKVLRWGGAEDAHRLIMEGIARAKRN